MSETLLLRYRELEAELAAAQLAVDDKRAAINSLLSVACGVDRGAIIRLPNGKRGRVSGVELRWVAPGRSGVFGRPWVSYNPEKKSGGWADVIRNAFDNWELITPATQGGEAP